MPLPPHWLVSLIPELPVNFTRFETICRQAKVVELPPV
jgi:hypothetical protein